MINYLKRILLLSKVIKKEINRILVELLTKRCMPAGIQIIEAKITELSYANEIAEVMLINQHILMSS